MNQRTEKTRFNLMMLIASDMSRHLFMVLLYLAVIGSALAVVVASHKNRELLIVHEELIQQKDKLDVEWRHLLIEQNALTEHNRIERQVEKDLGMYRPKNDEVVMIRER
ncbi:MAG: cell division protein FtsL [Pseudomonadota bacterium]